MGYPSSAFPTHPPSRPKWLQRRWAQVLDLPPVTEIETRPAVPCAVRSCDRLASHLGLCPGHLQMARDRFSPSGLDRTQRRADWLLAEAEARRGGDRS